MSKRIEILDQIDASGSDPIKVRAKLQYTTAFVPTDLSDNDIPNWASVLAIVPTGPIPDPTTITAGVDATPMTIAFDGNDSTSYALKRASDGSFDWNTLVTYDGSNFVITGDESSDVPGTFADSFIFGIRP